MEPLIAGCPDPITRASEYLKEVGQVAANRQRLILKRDSLTKGLQALQQFELGM